MSKYETRTVHKLNGTIYLNKLLALQMPMPYRFVPMLRIDEYRALIRLCQVTKREHMPYGHIRVLFILSVSSIMKYFIDEDFSGFFL